MQFHQQTLCGNPVQVLFRRTRQMRSQQVINFLEILGEPFVVSAALADRARQQQKDHHPRQHCSQVFHEPPFYPPTPASGQVRVLTSFSSPELDLSRNVELANMTLWG